MKKLKEVENIVGVKTDNLRQRIHRGTLRAAKKGRDWFISEAEMNRVFQKQIEEIGKGLESLRKDI